MKNIQVGIRKSSPLAIWGSALLRLQMIKGVIKADKTQGFQCHQWRGAGLVTHQIMRLLVDAAVTIDGERITVLSYLIRGGRRHGHGHGHTHRRKPSNLCARIISAYSP
jgi:hypothetical protein